jgi:putative ABC transport system permease protein
MNWVAIKMLVGDRAKFIGLIFGVTFATLLMAQQVSIFIGIVRRAGSQVLDVRDADIWVMDNKVRYIDEAPGLRAVDLQRVRGVAGVAWAVRFYKGQVQARLEDGNFRNVVLLGLDDATLVGAPAEMIAGELDDLRNPSAVIVDKAGYEYMWPGEPIVLGRVFEMNERCAVLAGVCKASAPFVTLPVLYTRFNEASLFVPRQRKLMNFILAKGRDGADLRQVVGEIERATGLAAFTQEGFFWKTIRYFLGSTGIPINFGITIALGFIVGAAVAGQTFYLFTLENLKQFGSIKAMGVTNRRIVGMILLQSASVGLLGYGLGIGGTALFFEYTMQITHLAGIHMYWQAMLGVGAAVLAIVVLAALLSIRRVLVLEPAVVFRG